MARFRISLRTLLMLVGVAAILLVTWLNWPRLHFDGAYRYFDTDTGIPDSEYYHYLSFLENGEFFYKTTRNSTAHEVFDWLNPRGSAIHRMNCAGKYELDGNAIEFETGRGAVSWHARLYSDHMIGHWYNENTGATQAFRMEFCRAPSDDLRTPKLLWPAW